MLWRDVDWGPGVIIGVAGPLLGPHCNGQSVSQSVLRTPQGIFATRILGGVQGGTGLRHWREDANPLLSVHAGLVLTPVNRAKGQHSRGFWIIDRGGLTDACGFKLAHSQRPKQDSNPGNRVRRELALLLREEVGSSANSAANAAVDLLLPLLVLL